MLLRPLLCIRAAAALVHPWTADNVIDGEGDTQGWNRYSYVKGNPVVYKDPTGHLATFQGRNGNQLRESRGPKGLLTKEQFKSFAKQAKEQLVKNLKRVTGAPNSSRARESFIKFEGKVIKINFRKDFSDKIGLPPRPENQRKTPEEVIKALDEKVLGAFMKTAFENDVENFTVVGLGRPKPGGGLHGTNDAMDITDVKFKGNKKTDSFVGQVDKMKKTPGKLLKFARALRVNTHFYSKYSNAKKVEILGPYGMTFYNNGVPTANYPNRGKTELEKLHKGHLHYGFR